jgi:hypothetical protein
MGTPKPEIMGAAAAAIAASSAGISRRLLTALPSGPTMRSMTLPTLGDIPRLVSGTLKLKSEPMEGRIARATAAALIYARQKTLTTPTPGLLHAAEHDACERWVGKKADYPTCRYCDMLLAILYGDWQGPPIPPFVIVRHSAHVTPGFDLDTNTSDAQIDKYQFLAPKSLAIQMLRANHPLAWHQAAPDIFQRSDPAYLETNGRNSSFTVKEEEANDAKRVKQVDEWEDKGAIKDRFIKEAVTWPWSDVISFNVENIIRISNFCIGGFSLTKGGGTSRTCTCVDDKSPAWGAEMCLSYDYSLASCEFTNFGLLPQPGGLDIDDGQLFAYARRGGGISKADVEEMTLKDLLILQSQTLDLGGKATLDVSKVDKSKLDRSFEDLGAAKEVVDELVRALQGRWGKGDDHEPWLVTVKATKSLRFTAPGNTPVELWATLTWMAPALLFSFLNRAVCQSIHAAALKPQPKSGAGASEAADLPSAPSPAPPTVSLVVPTSNEARTDVAIPPTDPLPEISPKSA